MARFAGFGMNAYFDIILQLTYMFAFITLCSIPAMAIYATYESKNGNTGALASASGYFFNQYSLGNFGGAAIACAQISLGVSGGSLNLQCPLGGYIDTTSKVQSGVNSFQASIIPGNAAASNYCSNSAIVANS